MRKSGLAFQPEADAIGSRWFHFGLAVCVAFFVLFVIGIPVFTRRPYTCAVCRANKVDSRLLVLTWSRAEDTECSRWYDGHVEPSHSHVWIECARCRRFGVPGFGGGYACSAGARLANLSAGAQMVIYEHFGNPLEAKELFLRLATRAAENERVWQQFLDWLNSGLPGTWAEWCQVHESRLD
jgi:hypothetical protein